MGNRNRTIETASSRSSEAPSSSEKSEWLPGACEPKLCRGAGVACKEGHDPSTPTHKCVCTSDHSTPGSGENPCRRRVVPTIPRPIFNIKPPTAGNSTSLNATNNVPFLQGATTEVAVPPPVSSAVVIILPCLFISIICAVAFCFWKRKLFDRCGGKVTKHESELSPLSLSKGLLGNYITNPQYQSSSPVVNMPVPILPRENLAFVQEIGEGCFGKVFKGQLRGENGICETVAVKVLKDGATKQAEEDFMREVEIMSTFQHENILTLLGVVLQGGKPWMVFEFMPHGDLAEVLRSNSKQLWKPLPGLDPLNKNDLLRIALQIAGGMRYLAAQRFVHNDLACRNCLVGAGFSVKIADFGMSRDIYTCDYYRIGGTRPVPLRWMSPESVMYRRFTLESDVWSYGVVLWEIFSLGMQPYFGLTNEEVVKQILQGILLIPPQGCPPIVCELMRCCWKTEPRDRIRFADIYEKLCKWWASADEEESSASCLPRPPVLPVADITVTDAQGYLEPMPGAMPHYIQPLPP